IGHRRRPVHDRGWPDRRRPGRAAAQHRGGDRYLRRGVLRHPAAGDAAACLDQRPPGPVPALERGRRHLGRGGPPAPPAVPLGRPPPVWRIPRAPPPPRSMAAATIGRLSGGTMASMRMLGPAGYLANRAAGRWVFDVLVALVAWATAVAWASAPPDSYHLATHSPPGAGKI